MKMVVTLRNGVQIKMDVEEFSTGRSPIGGVLKSLKWTGLADGSDELNWIDLSEVVAVHAEQGNPISIIKLPPEEDRAASSSRSRGRAG